MELEVALIRHGQTAGEKRFRGITDDPLDEECARLIQGCSKSGVYPQAALVFSSELTRCIETAGIIYPTVPKVLETDLRAPDYGKFEGKTRTELLNDTDFLGWMNSADIQDFPRGEKIYVFYERCAKVFGKICEEAAIKGLESISLITHKTVIQAIIQRFVTPRSRFAEWDVKPGGCYLLLYDTIAKSAVIIDNFDVQ